MKDKNRSGINMKKTFRAWYKSDIELGKPLLFEQKEIDFSLYFVMAVDSEFKYPFEIPFKDDDWVIEQFTGLKDKNGKKIYEGDIVKVSYKQWRKDWEGKDKWNYWDNIENIVFIYGGFMFHTVVFDTDMYRPMIPMFNNCELNGIEVIGNIHENKGE